MEKTRIALYGGAFNPPHLAHLFTVSYLLTRDDVDEVWFMPTARHVFGKDMLAFEDRCRLVEALIDSQGWSGRVSVSRFEGERPDVSRTLDTLTHLSSAYPEYAFCWVIGADNLAVRDQWHRFNDITASWPLIVLGRPGHEAALDECRDEAWCRPGPTLPDISSTMLREQLAGAQRPDVLAWIPHCIRERVIALYGRDLAKLPSVLVVGQGRMGRSLAASLALSGYDVHTWSRTTNQGADGHYSWPPMGEISMCFICVTDDAIEGVACELSKVLAGATPHILHCAGALGLEPLAALSELGCPSAVFHPVQSMTGSASDLNDAWCVCHGDQITLEILRTMVQRMGGIFVERDSRGHALYHAAAVLAGNFTTTLVDAGIRLLDEVQIAPDAAKGMLLQLVRSTLDNLSELPPRDALTGPFARADFNTIARHLVALDSLDVDLATLYRSLAVRTANMLRWDDEKMARLKAILALPAA